MTDVTTDPALVAATAADLAQQHAQHVAAAAAAASSASTNSPKERHSLTLDQRRALRRWAGAQPVRPSHKACIEWFWAQYGQQISQSTVSHSLSPKYSRLVPLAEIDANDFNLNLPRYIDSTEPEDLQDIAAHLKGGIPNADIDGLDAYWQVFPNVRRELFADADRPGYSQPKVEASQVKAAIFAHPEFTAFNQTVTTLFGTWKAANTPLLSGIKQGDRPKALIETLAESLLESFRSGEAMASLIDPYGVYQHLMDYWAETMQDDAWMIVSDSWKARVCPLRTAFGMP